MNSFGELPKYLKIFLIDPSEKNFSIFFKYLMAFTQAHLSSVKASGRKLPDQHNDSTNQLKSIASDIITNIVCNEHYPKYQKIFNIFKSKNLTSFEDHDQYELFLIFIPAFKKLINQEVCDIPKICEPQIANLLKQLKRAIDSDCYVIQTTDTRTKFIGIKENKDNPRIENEAIPIEIFENIVLESFNSEENTTRPNWLKLIFGEMNELTEYQNVVDKSLLISTSIRINSKYIDSEEFAPKHLSSVENSLVITSVKKAHKETLELISINHLQHFLENKKISEEEKQTIALAVDNFLTDFGYDGNPDKFPQYFKELVDIEDNKYQSDYKHIIDTIFRKALEIFKEKIRNDPTIMKFGRYFR